MNKAKNIVDFYVLANTLKYKIRTGWVEIDIKKERLESVAEHIYGALILAIAICLEYDCKVDLKKVLIMLTFHELEEIEIGDLTLRSGVTKEEKLKLGKKAVHKITQGLENQALIEDLLDEFNERKTKEAKFCYLIDKIECDFQAKIYDLMGAFQLEKAKEDLLYYGDLAGLVKERAKCASDYWIEYDKLKFQEDEIFKKLIDEIQKLKTIDIET